MAIAYSSAVKNNRLQTVLDALLGKTQGSATGTATAPSLVIGTSALSGATGVLATLAMDTTPATISGGVLTFSDMPLSASASAGGTPAKAEMRDNSGNVIISGLTVGTTGTDIVIASSPLVSGQTFQITSAAITHP